MNLKRKQSEVVWITIWLILSIVWISFCLYLLIKYGTWSKETIVMGIVVNIPQIIFLGGLFTLFKSQENSTTVEFIIHKYDRWDYNDSEYETRYIVERVDEWTNFIYYKNTGVENNKMSQDELGKYCNSLPREYDNYIGYLTQEEAMNEILQTVRDIIKYEKTTVNIKVKNIGTVQTLSIEEIKEIINSKGE